MARLAGDGKVILTPIVKHEERLGFEEYARKHVHAQVQENLDFRGIKLNATDFEGIHDGIVRYNVPNKSWSPEPYEGDDVPSEYVVNWQNVSVQDVEGIHLN